MNNHDRISAELSDDLINEIVTTVKNLRAKLPFLGILNAQDRSELSRMGEKSIGCDEKCAIYMNTHPEFVPGFVDMEEVARDRKLRAQLLQLRPFTDMLANAVSDAVLLVNSDIWMADLSYYQSVRAAAKRRIPGAEAIYQDLRTRFPGGGRPASETPADTPSPANP